MGEINTVPSVVDAGNVLDWIMSYEFDGLPEDKEIALFQYLIDTGMVWQLQGMYGRTATDLINAGLCTFDPKKRGIQQ